MKNAIPPDELPPEIKRLRSVLSQVPDRCRHGEAQHCRERLEAAVDRFCAFDKAHRRRGQIAAAREQKERIEALLELLEDLDELTEDEDDITVYEELALLFADISRLGRSGAAIMHTLRKRSAPSPG